ncbi:MBL fold metallo-hydrolase [Chryseobacterium sp.]|uniref:MBL fold metallo-hydrolase n=1 Tax=Chryseobacterium sp. TaxID=1871047 RepID=UPI000ED90BE3|nr:MBL fold metallo-hydrolase [Chryseobacterium sp.]HCM33522.1 MBL fold metallo-hydrolase [Chryseobacterium sp.]
MFTVQKFENTPIDSVTYIITNPENNLAIVIDPGTENDDRLLDYFEKNAVIPKFIFLTHEHFDHILGVNYLRSQFPEIEVIASDKTSERLPNPKKNLAIFHNQINLVVQHADILINEGKFSWINLNFEVFRTPGHTDSSISISLENSFFSGDFLLQGSRIVTNLPTGSKKQYQESIEKYDHLLKGLTIYPGHGESYIYE